MAYSVATSSTAQLANYLSWDVVWFFHPTLDFNYYPVDFPTHSDPRLEMPFNYDWETFADQAVAAGNVSAACVHVMSQGGFRYYQSGNKIPLYTEGGETYPFYSDDYGIWHSNVKALGITPDHVGRFVKAFRSRGMKVGFYLNERQMRNILGNNAPTNPQTTGRAAFVDFIVKEAKWLNNLYQPDFYWCDHPYLTTYTSGQRDQIYQALKGPHGGLVINNCANGSANITAPADIYHVEWDFLASSEGFYNPVTNISAVDYYCPKGIAYTGLLDSTGAAMYPAYANHPADGVTYNQVRAQSHFNQYYKYAKDRSMPFFCNIPPLNNQLIPTYYDRVKNTNLSAA